MHFTNKITVTIFLIFLLVTAVFPQKERRTLGLPYYTIETEHFKINYHEGVEHVAREVGGILEELYDIYKNTYFLTLPRKTEVLVSDDDQNIDNFAISILNTISISANDFGYNLRGSGNYMRDVVAHEFAHIVSIWSSFKTPAWIPYIQAGYFSHPNNSKPRFEGLHIIPSEILPPWFFEGIAQYESTRNHADRWDTHRDMILRTLTLSNSLLSWDHMNVFAGKGDDFEKTYNHGFSLVRYIAETYGYGSIVSILRESSKAYRFNFDLAIKNILGKSGRKLYREWKRSLEHYYQKQVRDIGAQVYGRKLNKEGFDNLFPRFSPDESGVYFLSNGTNDYSWGNLALYQYLLGDSIDDDKRIRKERSRITGFYDIHDSLGLAVYSTAASPRSQLPFSEGNIRLRDLAFDTIAPYGVDEKPPRPSRRWRKAHKHPITVRMSLFGAAFSPDGNRLAAIRHCRDKFYLCMLDTAGGDPRILYPDTAGSFPPIRTIFTVDWSPDGRHIAISYVEPEGDRKIGIYDTLENSFKVFCDTEHDERDPRYGHDGKTLYFASDRTGIFNIYRYRFETGTLERVTNVAGGAFTPDISRDGQKLVYVNYDKDGYGIYLIDTVKVLEQVMPENALVNREFGVPARHGIGFTSPTRYSRLPRQFIMVPTILSEQIVTEDNDPFQGKTAHKVGAVINLLDPFSWSRQGNELGAYFLIEPARIFNVFDSSVSINYDMGVFAMSSVLPVDISGDYLQRGVAGRDEYFDFTRSEAVWYDYGLTPRWLTLKASYNFKKLINHPIALHGIAGYNWFDVAIDDPEFFFKYTAAQGYRFGSFLTYQARKRDSNSLISPRGLSVKLKYEFWKQQLINEEKPFRTDVGWIAENYDDYYYNQVTLNLKTGLPAPWFGKHHFYLDLWGTTVGPTSASKGELPSYYEPGTWVPGYAYYYRTTRIFTDSLAVGDGTYTFYGTDSLEYDTLLVSGNAVSRIQLSYRFPLWKGSIDKKIWFIYLDRLYGAVNFHSGAGWHRPSDALKITSDEWLASWLKSIGAEIRLEALTFGNFPLALAFKWDRGLDKKAPIGGDRFTLSLGFSFDYWEYINEPDYRRPLTRHR